MILIAATVLAFAAGMAIDHALNRRALRSLARKGYIDLTEIGRDRA